MVFVFQTYFLPMSFWHLGAIYATMYSKSAFYRGPKLSIFVTIWNILKTLWIRLLSIVMETIPSCEKHPIGHL